MQRLRLYRVGLVLWVVAVGTAIGSAGFWIIYTHEQQEKEIAYLESQLQYLSDSRNYLDYRLASNSSHLNVLEDALKTYLNESYYGLQAQLDTNEDIMLRLDDLGLRIGDLETNSNIQPTQDVNARLRAIDIQRNR